MARESQTALSADLNWEENFKNKHLTDVKSTEFVSSYRTVIYARRAGTKSTDGTQTVEDVMNITDADNVAEFKAIGVVQAYNWNESRNIDYIFELGSDIPYLVPGRTIGQIALQRIMLNGQDIVNALYDEKSGNTTGITAGAESVNTKSLSSIKDITVPFDLLFVAFATNGSGENKYSRVFKNCQIESRSESIQAGAVILAESVNIRYETIVGITLPN